MAWLRPHQGDPSRARPCRASDVRLGRRVPYGADWFDGAVEMPGRVRMSGCRLSDQAGDHKEARAADLIPSNRVPLQTCCALVPAGRARVRCPTVGRCRRMKRAAGRSLTMHCSSVAARPPATAPACQDGICAFCPALQGQAARGAVLSALEATGPYRECDIEDSKLLALGRRQEKGPGLLRGPQFMIRLNATDPGVGWAPSLWRRVPAGGSGPSRP